MKVKKRIIAFGVLAIALIIAIGFTVVSNLDNKLKEVKVAKAFVTNLKDKEIIDTEVNLDEIEFKSISKLANKNSKTQYTVMAENIGIDLDSKYVVTGFSKKVELDSQNRSVIESNIIDEESAIEIAEEYVNEITNEKFSFKEIRKVNDEENDSNTHVIVFYKYFKNYPYYDNEIVVSINKTSGKLESYINQSINDVKHNLKRYIEVDEAKNIALNYFAKLNQEVEIAEEPLLAIIAGVNDDFELSYVVDIKTKSIDGKEDKYKLFINSESGEVLNRSVDVIETSRSN